VALTGEGALDFELLHGLEVAARNEADGVELFVLVHGRPVGEAEDGLYLFMLRRCPS